MLLEQRFCDIQPKTITALVTACKQRGLSARQLLDPVVGNEMVDSCLVYVEEEDLAATGPGHHSLFGKWGKIQQSAHGGTGEEDYLLVLLVNLLFSPCLQQQEGLLL